ncbi:hypothetical protein KZX50_22375 [Bacillus infantis]|uniref:hypothetical protein n=1 Tax=Bacillus infantis TaxID=324767 RepID=UPI0020033D19|nr:hypothetical protein [Bacillus infantis]MCK6208190.1 hypothetical protein [Bacillus infantis]
MRSVIVFILGFGLLLTGCTNDSSVTKVEAYKAEDIPLEEGSGRVTIAVVPAISDEITVSDGLIDVIISVKGLKHSANYEVLLEGDSNQGVVFGPKENVRITFGTMVGETLFKPNEQGELFVSMQHPLRIVLNAEETLASSLLPQPVIEI